MGIVFDPFSYAQIEDTGNKLAVLGQSLILPVVFLIASIGRLAKYRFFSPEDIDGCALSNASHEASVLQSLLQNTLEQLLMTVMVYSIWTFTMPTAWFSVLPLCSLLFAIGRIAFFKGYAHGAPARAFGFALTFYPSVLLMITIVIYQLAGLVGLSLS
ncbi:MAPEG family protein [Shewanella eurypsychrophilus]|uniref:MAPEG family protein n=1 Tax=Shewanella eurypsychrophilus TaxID=2593656 RepID=A0ABX8S929_9GAMM|nr:MULTISPECIES: MAPEG family protein [Shewanella]QXP44955.1 MAPEG family protein [Shewanella eurypsychrophilus]